MAYTGSMAHPTRAAHVARMAHATGIADTALGAEVMEPGKQSGTDKQTDIPLQHGQGLINRL
jgi:hypothetical protein